MLRLARRHRGAGKPRNDALQAQAPIPSAAQQIAGPCCRCPRRCARATVPDTGMERLVELRKRTNGRFARGQSRNAHLHAACYHESLEPFMARGRHSRGRSRPAKSTASGTPSIGRIDAMPKTAAALFSLSGPAGSWDSTVNEVKADARSTWSTSRSVPQPQPGSDDARKGNAVAHVGRNAASAYHVRSGHVGPNAVGSAMRAYLGAPTIGSAAQRRSRAEHERFRVRRAR